MSKLDDSLYGYFEEMQPITLPEDFSSEILNKCYEEKKLTLKQRVEQAVEINKAIVSNTTRFAGYIPGSKAAGKTVKLVGRGMGKVLKGCLSYGVRKLTAGTAK
jgi:hypothetical protein